MHGTTAIARSALAAFWATILLSLPLVLGFFGRLHPAFDSVAISACISRSCSSSAALPLLLARAFRKHGLLAAALGGAAILTVTARRSCRASARCRRPTRPGTREPGLPPAAAQSALRQSRAREGAVADRAGPAGRDHAQRSVRDVDRGSRCSRRVSLSIRLQGKSPRRRRGDPVAAAVRRGYGGPVPQRRDLRHRDRRFRRPIRRGRRAASALAVAVRPGRADRRAVLRCSARLAELSILAGDLNAATWSAASAASPTPAA